MYTIYGCGLINVIYNLLYYYGCGLINVIYNLLYIICNLTVSIPVAVEAGGVYGHPLVVVVVVNCCVSMLSLTIAWAIRSISEVGGW